MDLGPLFSLGAGVLAGVPEGAVVSAVARDPFDKAALIAMAKHDRAVWERESGAALHCVRKSFTDPRSAAASPARLARLRHIPFRDLRLGVRHNGRYVQGRIATPGFKVTSVMVVLESEEEAGTGCKLAIYNMCPAAAGPAEVDRLFPVCSRLAVKEPLFKRYLDGTCGLRVDNPADVVFLPPAGSEGGGGGGPQGLQEEEQPGGAGGGGLQELSRRGSELFGQGDYAGALRCYQRGLEAAEAAPDGVRATLLSNVAAAQLGLERWEEAYLAARRALDLDPSSSRARHRLARALLHLRCYGPALEHLRTATQQARCAAAKELAPSTPDPSFKAAAQLLSAAEVLAEQAQGRFSAAALLEGKAAGSGKAPATADWAGPLEVFDSPTAGRGLRATKAVAAGELLLVERALAAAQAPRRMLDISFAADGSMNRGSQALLAGTLLQVASAAALDRQRVLSLYSGGAGASHGPEVAGPAVLQPFATEEALQAALEAARAAAAAGRSAPDLLRAQTVVKYNAWGGGEHDPALPPTSVASGEHSRVWALLCAANHSCAPNAHVVFAGGATLAVLRASRPIAAGEEVTVAYNEDAVWRPLSRRQELLRSWGFSCRCARCAAEGGLPPGLRQEIEAVAAAVGDASSPGPWRQRYRQANALGGLGAQALKAEVCSRLQRLEAALSAAVRQPASGSAAGSSGPPPAATQQQRQVADLGLACVLPAYRLAAACAQMGGDLPEALRLHKAGLGIITAVRPGGLEHVTVAAIHAADAGRTNRVSELASRRAHQRLAPSAAEPLERALQAAKIRYGRELSDDQATRRLDRLLHRSAQH